MKNSEFILTPAGEIYHLRLKPGDLAANIITVGDPERVKLVQKYFDEIYLERMHREFATVTGRIGNTELSVVSTGIGTDNIDIVLNEIDALFNIDFENRKVKEEITSLDIFRLGTSGSLQTDIEAGEIVISESAVGSDNLMHFYHQPREVVSNEMMQELESYLGIEVYYTSGSEALIERFEDLGHHRGITFTCSGFYGPQGRSLRLSASKPDLLERLGKFETGGNRITNFEMETAGIYALAFQMGHRAISINAILANRINGNFLNNPDNLVDHMVRTSLEVIAKRED